MIKLEMSVEQVADIVELLREFRDKPAAELSAFRLAVDPAILDLLVHLNGKLVEPRR